MRRKRYNPSRVRIVPAGQPKRATRSEPGGGTVAGKQFTYQVTDGNLDRLNRWEFGVHVPTDKTESIEVKPLRVPGVRFFAGLERRAVCFVPIRRGQFSGKAYAKLFLATPDRSRKLVALKTDLPSWFKPFRSCLKMKRTVTGKASRDGGSRVAVVNRDDHVRMMKLYFALRVWVLHSGFEPRSV